MRIFYCGTQYPFYNKSAGTSFEHNNIYLSLVNYPGAEVRYFPFERILEVGRREFHEELLDAIRVEQPDLLFVFMLSDEVSAELLARVREETSTKSLAWFTDDHWRFHNYSRYWAKHFDWVVTTYSKAVDWYHAIGYNNVIRSQWAANTALYSPKSFGKKADVSFVGSWNQARAKIVKTLESSGIPVAVYGPGWKSGRLSQEEMIQFFSGSKINLGVNQPSVDYSLKSLGKIFFRRSADRIVPDVWHVPQNIKSWVYGRRTPQIKARIFEIPACGGLLFTSMADDLENYYIPGKEIVTYRAMQDLVEKVRYYLSHDEERERIARAGYERTIRDHVYEKRFRDMFSKMGLLK